MYRKYQTHGSKVLNKMKMEFLKINNKNNTKFKVGKKINN